MPTLRTINVVANPYIALNEDGVPQGVVAMPGSRSMHLGARLDQALTIKTGKNRFYFPLTRDKKAGTESPVVAAEFTPTIVRSVQDGELIAADEKSARMCGIYANPTTPENGFLPWEKALDREKERAAEYLKALLGDDAVVKDIPREADAEAQAWLVKSEVEAEAANALPVDPKKPRPARNAIVSGKGLEISPGVTLESIETMTKEA